MIFNLLVKPIAFLVSNFYLSIICLGINYVLIYQGALLEIQRNSQDKIDPLSFILGTLLISSFIFMMELFRSMFGDGKTHYEDQLEGIRMMIKHIKNHRFKMFTTQMDGDYTEGWIEAIIKALDRRLRRHGTRYTESHKQ